MKISDKNCSGIFFITNFFIYKIYQRFFAKFFNEKLLLLLFVIIVTIDFPTLQFQTSVPRTEETR